MNLDKIIDKWHRISKKKFREEILDWHQQEMTAVLDHLYKANDFNDPMRIITAIDAERASLRKIK